MLKKNSRTKYLKEVIYDNVKSDIINGKIQPGEIILETEIANKYKVSRTPVREAMGMLGKEGYIECIPKKGYAIKKIDYQDIIENIYIRILLESGATYQATNRISDEDIVKLEEILEEVDMDNAWEKNKEFHMLIAKASGNQKLIGLIEQLYLEMKRILMLDIGYLNIPVHEGGDEHWRIIKALKLKDKNIAKTAMEEHLQKTRDRIFSNLKDY